jgi:hypothetical protein
LTDADTYGILEGNQLFTGDYDMPKGKKTCENCGTMTGPRSYMCPDCNTPFTFAVQSKEKKTTKIIKNFNWRELEVGERIKATGGPYYVKGADFIPMGYRGKFTVVNVDDNGVLAYSEKGGYCHIYMGRDKQCPETKVWKTQHRLVKLKPKLPKGVI